MVGMERTKMYIQEPEKRKNNFSLVSTGYTKDEAIEEAKRCLNCKIPQCSKACPIQNRIPEFISEVKAGNFEKAYEIIKTKSLLSDICSTVCPHEKQCEGSCVRGIKGEPIAIGSIERFVSEWANENLKESYTKEPNGKKIAIIGAGPAGISCALYLLSKGYKVVFYEKENYVGGVLKWGIPSFRLSDKIVDNYYEKLKKMNAEFHFNYRVGKDNSLDDLLKNEGYDACFIGIGACSSNVMNIEGEDLKGVYSADDFLSKINLSELKGDRRYFDECGERVLIVGGGNVAMDAARCAVRLPQVKKVSIVYRRTEQEMPACSIELEHAKEEGIEFLTLKNPVKFIGKDGKLTQAECAVMVLGEPDASGRRRPVESDEDHIFLDVDTCVLALGFSNEKEISMYTKDLEADKWGCFIVDENNMTSREGIYAGGDAVTGADTVVRAMKAGINAAKAIDTKLS